MATAARRRAGSAYVLTGATAVASGIAAATTLFVSGVLHGPAVMNGSARGTALVCLFVATPALVVSAALASRETTWPVITWLGATAYLVYNAFMFLFMSPFNSLFLLYVAMFAFGVWTLIAILHDVDVESFARKFSPALPARAIAAFLVALAVLNAAAWLVQVLPASFSSEAPPFLAGTGLPTPAGWAQDLGFWIPLMVVGAVWMWQRKPWGLVLVGPLLVFGVIEGVGVAVDQWMGHAADPSSSVVAAIMTPIFAGLALIELVPLYFYFRNLARR